MRFLKPVARWLLGDYGIYRVYACEKAWLGPSDASRFQLRSISSEDLAKHGPELSELDWYLGPESHAFGCWEAGELIAVAFFWHGERYRQRNFWPLQTGEAKLVQLHTISAARGRGAATFLIRESTRSMIEAGFVRVFARVWHSNRPSFLAFERAGYKRCGDVVEVFPFGLGRPMRWVRRSSGPEI